MATDESKEWKLVTEYPVSEYKCGLRSGDKVRLIRDLRVTNPRGVVTHTYPEGEIWEVINGTDEEPPVIWLLMANGKRHVWSDDEEFFEQFCKID